MDDNTTPGGQPDEQNLFKPDDDNTAVTSDQRNPSEPVPPASSSVAPADSPAQPEAPADSITWTASEFIAHHKSVGWYLVLALCALVLAAGVWFLTKDKVSTGVVIAGAILLGVYAAHKPREQSYTIDNHGLTIGGRYRSFGEFRSFSIVPEGAFSSIEFMPLKRFAMFTTVYFDPTDQAKIIGLLSAHLSLEERSSDPIDQLMRRIRF